MVVKPAGLTHRQRQALATRRQIAGAARVLFAERGYVTTTITAIAEAADIPAPTIYSAFGSKAKILQDIAWEATGPLDVDRTHDEALAQADPATGLRMVAQLQRRQYEAMFDVIAVYQEAARTDPDIDASLQVIMGNRERGFGRHMETISQHLAPGLTVADATGIYLALVLPEIYRTLVVEHGWSADRYEAWLAGCFVQQLLAGAGGAVRAAEGEVQR